jgi:hypothetical protein
MPRKSKERHFCPYLAGLKNSYPEILRRYKLLFQRISGSYFQRDGMILWAEIGESELPLCQDVS